MENCSNREPRENFFWKEQPKGTHSSLLTVEVDSLVPQEESDPEYFEGDPYNYFTDIFHVKTEEEALKKARKKYPAAEEIEIATHGVALPWKATPKKDWGKNFYGVWVRDKDGEIYEWEGLAEDQEGAQAQAQKELKVQEIADSGFSSFSPFGKFEAWDREGESLGTVYGLRDVEFDDYYIGIKESEFDSSEAGTPPEITAPREEGLWEKIKGFFSNPAEVDADVLEEIIHAYGFPVGVTHETIYDKLQEDEVFDPEDEFQVETVNDMIQDYLLAAEDEEADENVYPGSRPRSYRRRQEKYGGSILKPGEVTFLGEPSERIVEGEYEENPSEGMWPLEGPRKIPDGSVVDVEGWIMLKGVPAGTYRVEYGGDEKGRKTYQFFRPRGKKPLARHYESEVDLWVKDEDHPDLNKIVVTEIPEITKVTLIHGTPYPGPPMAPMAPTAPPVTDSPGKGRMAPFKEGEEVLFILDEGHGRGGFIGGVYMGYMVPWAVVRSEEGKLYRVDPRQLKRPWDLYQDDPRELKRLGTPGDAQEKTYFPDESSASCAVTRLEVLRKKKGHVTLDEIEAIESETDSESMNDSPEQKFAYFGELALKEVLGMTGHEAVINLDLDSGWEENMRLWGIVRERFLDELESKSPSKPQVFAVFRFMNEGYTPAKAMKKAKL